MSRKRSAGRAKKATSKSVLRLPELDQVKQAVSNSLGSSRQLAPGTINVRLAAVRRLAYEAADCGLLSPELAAGIRRLIPPFKGQARPCLASHVARLWLATPRTCQLTFENIPRREDHWVIVDLVGKGGHIRTVPIPDWVKMLIDTWMIAARIDNGRLFRCVCRADKV